MPASPFDFEDPERFVAAELFPLAFPVGPDVEYVLGVRLTRSRNGWLCPHKRMWSPDPKRAALDCLKHCEKGAA